MLSSHLPGQEAGNVPFVVGKGFGRFSTQPKVRGTWSLVSKVRRGDNPSW